MYSAFECGRLTAGHRLGLLHDCLPVATTFALLINPTNRLVLEKYLEATQAAARSLGLQLIVVAASSEQDIDTGFATMVEQRIGALTVATDALFTTQQDQILALAARHAVPTMYSRRETVVAGGLMSYGSNLATPPPRRRGG